MEMRYASGIQNQDYKSLFERDDHLKIGTLKSITDHMQNDSSDNPLEIAERGLNPEELFLTNGFSLILQRGGRNRTVVSGMASGSDQ